MCRNAQKEFPQARKSAILVPDTDSWSFITGQVRATHNLRGASDLVAFGSFSSILPSAYERNSGLTYGSVDRRIAVHCIGFRRFGSATIPFFAVVVPPGCFAVNAAPFRGRRSLPTFRPNISASAG
jgi:hypothetical protein